MLKGLDAALSTRKGAVAALCALFVLLLTALLTKTDATMAGNEASRLATVQAFAERGTFAIENAPFRTVDHIVIGEHVYSDKPLVQSFLLGLLYKALAFATGISFESAYGLSIYLTVSLGVGLLNVALFLLFLLRLDRDCEAPFLSKLLLSASLPLATLLLSYGVSMNNHTPSAFLLLLLAFQLVEYAGTPSPSRAFLAGLTAGLLLDFEIPVGAFFGVGAFVSVALASGEEGRLRKLCLYSLGGLLPILFMLLLNHIAFGRMLPQYIGAGSSGTFKLPLPGPSSFGYAFDVLFGARGFFSYMPAMLFIVPALLRRRSLPPSSKAKVETALLWTCGAVALFYVVCTNEYGGWAYGFRYLVPLIPIVWLFIARDCAPAIGSARYALLCALLLWGLVVSYVGAYNPWCNVYEGFRSPPGSVDFQVRNSFAANLLCIGFEAGPDSPLFKLLAEKVYGKELAAKYLVEAFINMKNLESLAKVKAYCESDPELKGRFAFPSGPSAAGP